MGGWSIVGTCFLAIGVAHTAAAQTVHGTVYETDSEQVVDGASVRLLDREDEVVRTARTDTAFALRGTRWRRVRELPRPRGRTHWMTSPIRSLLAATFAVLASSCGSDSSTEPLALDLSRTVIVVQNGQTDVPTQVTIELRDEEGGIFTEETPSPVMEVSGENAGAETEVTRNGEGTFTASYTPISLGMDTLRFTHEGSALPGGPFPSRVRIVFETGVGAPILDGVLSAGEWDGATAYPVFAGPLAGSTVRFMVDDTDLYVAARAPDPGSGNGSFAVRFDNTVDLVPAGDDLVSYGEALYDGHFDDVYMPDDVPHGDGARMSADGWTVFELRHPLSSGDPQDISVARGGSVGVCVVYGSSLTSFSSEFTYPPQCSSVIFGVPTYAELLIAP